MPQAMPTVEDVVTPMSIEDAVSLVKMGKNPEEWIVVSCPVIDNPRAGIGVQIGAIEDPPGTRLIMLPALIPAGTFKDISTSRLRLMPEQDTRQDARAIGMGSIPHVLLYVYKPAASERLVALAKAVQASADAQTEVITPLSTSDFRQMEADNAYSEEEKNGQLVFSPGPELPDGLLATLFPVHVEDLDRLVKTVDQLMSSEDEKDKAFYAELLALASTIRIHSYFGHEMLKGLDQWVRHRKALVHLNDSHVFDAYIRDIQAMITWMQDALDQGNDISEKARQQAVDAIRAILGDTKPAE